MGLLETLGRWFVPQPMQERHSGDFPDLETQIAAIRRRQAHAQPWRAVGTTESLAVPAIFRAVSLISNTVGSLSLEAFRQGQLLTNRNEIPRLIQRPNPFTTPRVFFRDTAYYLSTRGEAWWWVAARDVDGVPMSLYPVPPWEITVAANDRNRLQPIIKWADRTMANEDMRQITYLPGRDGLRGVGPLQLCGAAASVAVESQEWAANFYASNIPSLLGETEQDMSEDEMTALKEQWLETSDPNLPRFVTNGLKIKDFTIDPGKAQLTESREFQVGEVARMFGIPGLLIEFNSPGQSLRYQNTESVWRDFLTGCLSPNYLEPVEQEIGDLLTRSTVARFNTAQLLRADIKTRYEVYEKAVAVLGPIEAEQFARVSEGMAPGNVDFAPVPLAPPAAIPTLLPPDRQLRSLEAVHCGGTVIVRGRRESCGRVVGETTGPYRIKCPRCGTVNQGAAA